MKILTGLFNIRFAVGIICIGVILSTTYNKLEANIAQVERNYIYAIAAHPVESTVAICSNEGVFIYDAESGESEQVSNIDCGTVAWINTNTLLALDYENGAIVNVLSSDLDEVPLENYSSEPSVAYNFQWSQDGQYLVNGIYNLLVWQVDNGDLVHELNGVPPNSFSLSPDGQLAAFRSSEMGVEVWDVSTETLSSILIEDMHVGDITWSPDGKYFAFDQIYNSVPTITIWDMEKNEVYGSWSYEVDKTKYSYGLFSTLAWNEDSDQVAISIQFVGKKGDYSNSVFIWNINSGEISEEFQNILGDIYGLSWGNLLAGVGYEVYADELYIWTADRFGKQTIILYNNLNKLDSR
jgi:WD40 repeat protein